MNEESPCPQAIDAIFVTWMDKVTLEGCIGHNHLGLISCRPVNHEDLWLRLNVGRTRICSMEVNLYGNHGMSPQSPNGYVWTKCMKKWFLL